MFCVFVLFNLTMSLSSTPPTPGETDADAKARSLLKQMTLDEKIAMLSGYNGFYLHPVKRLGIPAIRMADGPMGVRVKKETTAFPATLAMTATWNQELMQQIGIAIGKECKTYGVDILLAPGVNLYRVPQNGRNFEYMGEDPFLAAQMVTAYIKGVQSQNVIATVKHYICNNLEYDRHRTSSDVDERTLREIYLPPYKAAVTRGGAWALMTAYNLVNGIHCSEHDYLLNHILKKEWGFKGIAMSDWISVYSTNPLNTGLDLEMPKGQFINKKNIIPLLENRTVSQTTIDDKVLRILRACIAMGLYDKSKPAVKTDFAAHNRLALRAAHEGIVLLKNSPIEKNRRLLPINIKTVKTITVLGPTAEPTPASGGGAALVKELAQTSILAGIKKYAESAGNAVNKTVNINYLPCKEKKLGQDDIKKITQSDAVVVCVGFNKNMEGEGHDRPFALPREQNKLIETITALNKNTIVVIVAGGGIDINQWLGKTGAVLHSWYGGQEAGTAVADILFGKVNPSGKLPISIEKSWADSPAYGYYDQSKSKLGTKPLFTIHGKPHKIEHVPYKEGIYTGYRGFDKRRIQPLFPFGFGLSYTAFEYSDLKFDKETVKPGEAVTISLSVTNTGKRAGGEIVQVYVSDPQCTVHRPKKELKGFAKVFLKPGETKRVTVPLSDSAFSFYDVKRKQWTVEPGEFIIRIGTSSADIKLSGTIKHL